MREKTVENYLRSQCKAHGAVAEKFTGAAGRPDEICSWPFGFKDWVETKRPKAEGGRVKKVQERDHKRRRAMGHDVWVVFTKPEVDNYITFCVKRHNRVLREIE